MYTYIAMHIAIQLSIFGKAELLIIISFYFTVQKIGTWFFFTGFYRNEYHAASDQLLDG